MPTEVEFKALQEQLASLQTQLNNNTSNIQTPNVNHVGVKIPPFWTPDPVLWFTQLEAQFELAHISTETTKYNHLLSALDGNTLTIIADLIKRDLPATYIELKQALISRCTDTEEQRIRKLLTGLELGDQKPSVLLRKIKAMASSNTADKIIKELWVQQLPVATQSILQVMTTATIDELATAADRIGDVSHPSPSVAPIQTTPVESDSTLQVEIAALRQQVRDLTSQRFSRFDSHRRSTSPRYRQRFTSRVTKTTQLCWYHYTFGDNARTCKPPCSYGNAKNA